MAVLIDSSVWVDYFRPKTPIPVRKQAAAIIDSAEIFLCEPVQFEILRSAPSAGRDLITRTFATVPLLPTPFDLWSRATELGRKCGSRGYQITAMDILIAQIALSFHLELVTFDTEFAHIAQVSPLKVNLLKRAAN